MHKLHLYMHGANSCKVNRLKQEVQCIKAIDELKVRHFQGFACVHAMHSRGYVLLKDMTTGTAWSRGMWSCDVEGQTANKSRPIFTSVVTYIVLLISSNFLRINIHAEDASLHWTNWKIRKGAVPWPERQTRCMRHLGNYHSWYVKQVPHWSRSHYSRMDRSMWKTSTTRAKSNPEHYEFHHQLAHQKK